MPGLTVNDLHRSHIEMMCAYPKTAKPYYRSYYITDEERKYLLAMGDPHYLLYEFSLQRVSKKIPELLTDSSAAEHFGWSESKAKKVRLKLERAGWIRVLKSKMNNGTTVVHYYVGQGEVEKSYAREKLKPLKKSEK